MYAYMRLHRFYSSETITTEQGEVLAVHTHAHQWYNVFRLRKGDSVILFDGSLYEFIFEIQEIDSRKAQLMLVEKRAVDIRDKRQVVLNMAMVKKDTFEVIVQKATELGVQSIQPIIAERSEKKGLNIDRAKKIIIEAVEQSGRVAVPILGNPLSFKDVLDNLDEKSLAIAFDPTGQVAADFFVKDNLMLSEKSEAVVARTIHIFIGPEGGWSDAELGMFKERGVRIYSLGNAILRAETAAVAALAKILL